MAADAMSYGRYSYTPYLGTVGSKAMGPASGPLATGPLTRHFFESASEPKSSLRLMVHSMWISLTKTTT